MKCLIALSTFIICSVSFACTNFSGTYYFQENNQTSQIVQSGCEKITMISPDLTMTVVADNVIHEVANQDIIVEGQNLGKMIVNARAHFGEKELFLDMHLHLVMMGQTQDQESTSVSTLLANGDMQSVSTQDGQTTTTIGKKVK
jgi:hypothetical protein